MRAKFELCRRKRDYLLMLRHNSPAGTEANHDKQRKFELRTPARICRSCRQAVSSNPRHTALFYLFHTVKRGDKLSSPPPSLSLSLSLVRFISIARKRVPLIVLVFITPTYQSSQPNARLPAGRLCLPSPHCYFS